MRLAAAIFIFALSALPALAQLGPFGTGVPAEPVVGFGFDQLIIWTANAQADFYRGLTAVLRQVGASPAAFGTLLGLSFLYGVVHAAGPGHGKVVIGSYMLASGDTARRGALLAVAAAMVQATGAVLVVGLLAGLFGLGQTVLSDATITLERLSYTLIIGIGLYLVWRLVHGLLPARKPATLHAAAAVANSHSHAHHHAEDHAHGPDCGCGHVHMPDAETVRSAQGFAQLAAVVVGAGIRPCTGALLILVLALSQGLFWQGAAAAYAMGIGTALTVGVLAVMAGSFSSLMGLYGSHQGPFIRFGRIAVQLLGALLIIGFGALLLAASLTR